MAPGPILTRDECGMLPDTYASSNKAVARFRMPMPIGRDANITNVKLLSGHADMS
jgi:hypothetical protein